MAYNDPQVTPMLPFSTIDVLRDEYLIGARHVRLGEVVQRAKTDSTLDAVQWAELSEIERTFWTVAALFAMRAELEMIFDA